MTGTNKEFGSTEKTVKAPGRPVDLNGPIDLDGPSGATMMEVSFAAERQTGLWHWMMVLAMTGVLVVMGVNTFFPPERPPLRTSPPAAYLAVVMGDRDGWTHTISFQQDSAESCEEARKTILLPQQFKELKESRGVVVSAECVSGHMATSSARVVR